MTRLGVELVEVLDNAVGNQGGNGWVVRLHAESDDVCLIVGSPRDTLVQLFHAFLQAIGEALAAYAQDSKEGDRVACDRVSGRILIMSKENPLKKLAALDDFSVEARRLACLSAQ